MHGYDEDKAKVIARLRRIEGQVRAITQMVEDDKYCIDILTQISASNSALKSVALLLLDDHLPRPSHVSSNRDEFCRMMTRAGKSWKDIRRSGVTQRNNG